LILEQFEKDPEFKGLSKEQKGEILLNYFDTEMADDEFRALPVDQQDSIKTNFLQSEGIRPDLSFHRVITQAARGVWKGLGDMARYLRTSEERADFDKLLEKDPILREIARTAPEEIPKIKQRHDKVQKQITESLKKFEERVPEPLPGSSGRVEDAAVGMAEFLPAMGISVFSPLAAIPVTYAAIAGAKLEEYKSQNIDDDRAWFAANMSAAAQTPLEWAGNLLQVGFLKNFAGKVIKGPGVTRAIDALVTIGENAFTEGMEEYLQQFPDELSNIYAANPDLTPTEMWEEFKRRLPEFNRNAIEAAKTGAVGGGMMAGTGVVIASPAQLVAYKSEKQRTIDQQKETVVSEKQNLESFVDQINQDIKSGEVTLEDIRSERAELSDDDPIAQAMDVVLATEKPETLADRRQKEIERIFAEEQKAPEKMTAAERQRQIERAFPEKEAEGAESIRKRPEDEGKRVSEKREAEKEVQEQEKVKERIRVRDDEKAGLETREVTPPSELKSEMYNASRLNKKSVGELKKSLANLINLRDEHERIPKTDPDYKAAQAAIPKINGAIEKVNGVINEKTSKKLTEKEKVHEAEINKIKELEKQKITPTDEWRIYKQELKRYESALAEIEKKGTYTLFGKEVDPAEFPVEHLKPSQPRIKPVTQKTGKELVEEGERINKKIEEAAKETKIPELKPVEEEVKERVEKPSQKEKQKTEKKQTKREKAMQEFNDYVKSLSKDEQELFKPGIERERNYPATGLFKLKQSVEEYRKKQSEPEKPAPKVEEKPTEPTEKEPKAKETPTEKVEKKPKTDMSEMTSSEIEKQIGKPLKDIEVKVKYTNEEGRTVRAKEPANEAIETIDEQIDLVQRVLNCLRG